MAGQRNPDLSRAIERAKEIMADDSTLSRAEVCRRASKDSGYDLKPPTLKYRLQHEPPAAHKPDNLDEFPTNESEILVFERDYSDREAHRIYPIGDLHIGSPEHAEGRLDEWLNYLVDTDHVSMLNTGDNTNCAIKTSVSDTYTEKLTVKEGRELQTEKFRPLAEGGKIDAIIDGNHERRVRNAIGDSPNAAVASALGLNYAPSLCVVRYLVGDQSYTVCLRHGTGGGKKIGGQANQLEAQLAIIDCDVYVTGHTHTQLSFPRDRFVDDGEGGFTRKKHLFVSSASFLAYEPYAAEAGFQPAHIGAPRIFLDGTRKDAHASV